MGCKLCESYVNQYIIRSITGEELICSSLYDVNSSHSGCNPPIGQAQACAIANKMGQESVVKRESFVWPHFHPQLVHSRQNSHFFLIPPIRDTILHNCPHKGSHCCCRCILPLPWDCSIPSCCPQCCTSSKHILHGHIREYRPHHTLYDDYQESS